MRHREQAGSGMSSRMLIIVFMSFDSPKDLHYTVLRCFVFRERLLRERKLPTTTFSYIALRALMIASREKLLCLLQ